jgi:hypothetical protein
VLTFLVYILTIAGGMMSITEMDDVTGEVLDVIRTTSTASLPLKLKDIGCRCDGVQGRQLAINSVGVEKVTSISR